MAQINRAYATTEELRASIGAGSPDNDIVAGNVLLACSRLYTRLTHQFYNVDETAVPRIWIGNGTDTLKVYGGDNCPGIAPAFTDDAWGPPSITVAIDSGLDGSFATALMAGQYELWPLNAPYGDEPKPYKEIGLPPWITASLSTWPTKTRVKVTARYGWGQVPAGVKADVIELAGIWLGVNPRATGNMNELETVVSTSIMANSLVKKLQQAYYEPVVA